MLKRTTIPLKVCFILNVGRDANGDVIIGSCNKPGCHFALVVLDTVTKKLTYPDSLAWKPPTNLIDFVG